MDLAFPEPKSTAYSDLLRGSLKPQRGSAAKTGLKSISLAKSRIIKLTSIINTAETYSNTTFIDADYVKMSYIHGQCILMAPTV